MFLGRHRWTAVWLLFAVSLTLDAAAAEPQERILAETLFQRGKTMMEAGQYEQACADLAESLRLDPAGGTQLTLALCYERAGRLGSAWVEFLEAIAFAQRDGRADRERIAREHSARLESIVPRIVVRADQAAQAADLSTYLDGKEFSRSAWATNVPVDPGTHVIEARASGYRTWSRSVQLEASQREEIVIPPLEALGPTSSPPQRPPPPAQPVAKTPAASSGRRTPVGSTQPVPHDDGDAQRIAGFAVGGAGIVLLVTGVVFGVQALELANEICDRPRCPADEQSTYDSYQTSATAANITIGLGLLSIGAGALLLLTDRHREPAKPAVSWRPMRTPGLLFAF